MSQGIINNTKQSLPGFNAKTLSVLVVGLYLAHSLPLYFFNVALPAILREQGVDLRVIGMMSLLYLPWAFKFLWAPLVDRFYWERLGPRRTWLIATQLSLIFGVLGLAVLGLNYGVIAFVLCSLWISTMAATQDIAIDGYTVESYPRSHFNLASTAQSAGVALGSMIGGAGSLWIYERFGWEPALITLAVLIGLITCSVIFMKEGRGAEQNVPPYAPAQGLSGNPTPENFAQPQIAVDQTYQAVSLVEASPSAPPPAIRHKPNLALAFRRPEIRRLLLVILLYRLVEAPAMAMLNPMLVDAKWSLTQIGVLFSVVGAGVGLGAAVTAGVLIKRHGAVRWLLLAAWLRTAVYVLIAGGLLMGALSFWGLSAAVLAVLAIRYVAMTALYAYFMEHCSTNQAGTDFTILVCFELLVYFVGAAASGFLVNLAGGYGVFYALLSVISLLSVCLCHVLMHEAPNPSAHTD